MVLSNVQAAACGCLLCKLLYGSDWCVSRCIVDCGVLNASGCMVVSGVQAAAL